jgi:hypothetical protein
MSALATVRLTLRRAIAAWGDRLPPALESRCTRGHFLFKEISFDLRVEKM